MSESEKIKVRSLEVAFDIPSWNRIQELKKKAGIEEDVVLFRRALELYEWFNHEIASGGKIAVVRNGKPTVQNFKFE